MWLQSLPIDLREPAMLYRMDLRLGCATHDVFQQHISKCFARLMEVEIESTRPLIFLDSNDRRAAAVHGKRPYVVFNMHSVSNPDRADGKGRRKDWPLERWSQLADRIADLGEFDIFVIGSERDPRVNLPKALHLYGLPIRTVAALLESAACVITVENGIGHLCAAVGATVVVIYSDWVPLGWASPADLSRALTGASFSTLLWTPVSICSDTTSDKAYRFTNPFTNFSEAEKSMCFTAPFWDGFARLAN